MRKSMIAVVAVAAITAGCGAPSLSVPVRPSTSIAAPRPPGMVDSGPITGAKSPTECIPDHGPPDGKPFVPEKSSLRPPQQLPQPLAMPAGSTMAKIVARGYLLAGVDRNLSKFSSVDPHTGKLVGFDVDVVREIAKALFGDENAVRFVGVNFTNNFDTLTDPSHKIDILADSITITCERRYGKKIMFSSEYFLAGQRVMVPKVSTVKSIQDLQGKKVCAPDGTTSIGLIENSPYELEPVAVREFSDCLALLQQHQVDAVSSTDTVLLGMVEQDPTTHMVGERLSQEHHGLAMRDSESEQDFVRFVNGVLQQMREDKTWARLYENWLGQLEDPDPDPPVADYLQETP